MSEEIIRETISVTRTQISEEDKEIAADYTALVRRGLRMGHKLLTFGTPEVKLRIITATIQSAARLASIDSKSEVEEHRVAFQQLLSRMTELPEATTIVTPESIDVISAPFPRPTHNQDDEE